MREEEHSRTEGELPSPRTVRHPSIRQALEFTEEHLSSHDLTVEAVAGAVSLSKSYFSRLFRKVVGFNYRQYLLRLRVERAAELIAMEPYRSVTDVAFAAGFKSVRTFEDEFRKLKGETPSEYRRRHRPG